MLHPPMVSPTVSTFHTFHVRKSPIVGAQICISLIEQVYVILASGEDAWNKNPNIFSHMLVNRKQITRKTNPRDGGPLNNFNHGPSITECPPTHKT